MNEEPRYEAPAIEDRLPIADPLIVGVYASPVWRRSGEEGTDPRG